MIENMFGRIRQDGNIDVLYADDGCVVTRIDANIYPVGSQLGCRYEHPEGIVLTPEDAATIKLPLEDV